MEIIKKPVEEKDKQGPIKMEQIKRQGSYSLVLESEVLPFVYHKRDMKSIENSNETLQKFIRLIEKKFDAIWYIGTDIFGDEIYERFMFHHGGFMEINLSGKLRVYFNEDKIGKFKEALRYAVEKLSSKGSASHLMQGVKVGQKLISIKDSVMNNINKGGKR